MIKLEYKNSTANYFAVLFLQLIKQFVHYIILLKNKTMLEKELNELQK